MTHHEIMRMPLLLSTVLADCQITCTFLYPKNKTPSPRTYLLRTQGMHGCLAAPLPTRYAPRRNDASRSRAMMKPLTW